MTAQKIRAALSQLQGDPDNEASWHDLFEAVTSPDSGIVGDELRSLLESARRGHELRREWDAVARLLELEAGLHAGTPVEFAMQFELARVLEDELFDDRRASAAYQRLVELRADDPTAQEALERGESRRRKWKELVARYLEEAQQTTDHPFKSSLLMSAAEVAYRYGSRSEEEIVAWVARLEQALELDRTNARAAALLEHIYGKEEAWLPLARVLELRATEGGSRDERAAALVRLARLFSRKLTDDAHAATAYERLLELWPLNSEAMSFLSEHHSNTEQWDQLVALYESQLRTGPKPGEEAGVVLQIAMVNWRMRKRPDLAEPYFDRLRRLDPAHRGMLAFFRETLGEQERPRLLTILTDAQRSLPDNADKRALATEIAQLAEAGANAQKAIDQYKTILRGDANNLEARSALRRLYAQTEGWNALIELLRQDLERTPADEHAGRLVLLREIAAIYRDQIKSDTALVTVLTQIVQLEPSDVPSLRELVRVYETLSRFRDLLAQQTSLAALLPAGQEKTELLRAVARRWLDQFSNVQNATDAYELLLATEPGDVEAVAKLRELYAKRRAWPALYGLVEREAETAKGSERIALLGEMAKLAAERLDRGADAIRLYKTILSEDPSRSDVLDLLERQADRDKDFGTVAWTLEQRLGQASDDAARLSLLQKLGGVYSDRLADHIGAEHAWRRVLSIQPGHPKALRVLRDSYLANGDFNGLEELYSSQGDWEGLAEVFSGAADRATDPELKVALSFRTARVLTDKVGAKERAFRAYERILSVHPDDATAARPLVEIYEAEQKWSRLPALYEVLLASSDDEQKLDILRRLVDVTGSRLGDRTAATQWARQAYDLSPSDERLPLLEEASRAAKSWELYLEAVTARLKKRKGITSRDRRALKAKLARLYATELGRIDDAIAAYRGLVEDDPTDDEAIAALDKLLRGEDRREDLRWLFELRAAEGPVPARAAILTDWASLEQDAFGEPGRAAALYKRVLQLDPSSDVAARRLSRLLLASGEAQDAASVIEAYLEHTEGTARAERELDVADIYIDHLSRPERALDAAARALGAATHFPRAIAMLERLLAMPETRARSARLLADEYAELRDPRRRAQAITVLLESARNPSERLDLFTTLAELEEHHLQSSGRAFDVVLQALTEFPEDLPLWDRANLLAAKSMRPIDLAEAYRSAVRAEKPLSEANEVELSERAATLYDEKLGDPEAATPYLERILRLRPGDERAFSRLKQILTSAEKWGELESLYARAVQGTTDPERRVDLLNEVALVCEEITNEPGKAIAYYESILAIDPRHDNASRALEQLYAREGCYEKLAALLEQRLENASPEATIGLKVRLGQINLDQLHDPARALSHLEDVLRREVNQPDARQLVERVLDIGSLRSRAAEVLENVYESRDEVRDLVRVLEIRRETATTDDLRRELLRRVASLRDERLRDDAGALDALARLVPLDPTDVDARERMAEVGKRLGQHERVAAVLAEAADVARDPALRSAILMQVAELAETELADGARAEAQYKAALAISPKDPDLALPPARALERLYSATGNHVALAEILVVEVALEPSVTRRRELLARLGDLAETVLEDPARAISAWRQRLEDEPNDEQALLSLERLYANTASWRELVATLRARELAASAAEPRRAILTKVAETLNDKLGDQPEAILAYRAVLDEFGPERETLTALESLYEATERYADLADTLDVDLSLSEDPALRVGVLSRLGEVRRIHQRDWQGALEAFRQALALDPKHPASRFGIEQLLDVAPARREAAETLHPLYEADGDSERLLRVLEIEADAADTPDERLAFLDQATQVAETQLHDVARAFAYAVRAVREAAGEQSIASWLERAERLAAAADKYADLVSLEREVLPQILDEDVQLHTSLRIGELARTKLGDRELARAYYQKALELRSDDRRALSALESLYEEASDAPALLDILKRRVEVAEDESEKKDLLFRQARLSADQLGDRDAAIAVYETILDITPDPRAIEQLEALYEQKERWSDLVALYERQLGHEGVSKPDLHVKIAKVLRAHLRDVSRAFDELEAALGHDSQHQGAVSELEALLAHGESRESRARAAEMLEPVYQRRGSFAELMRTLEARLEASQDPDQRRPLLRRLANLREEQAEDYRGALETTAKLLHEDVTDESTWSDLERLAKVAGADNRLAEIYAAELDAITSDEPATAKLARRVGKLFARLGDVERALAFLRRAHRFEPESAELFTAIDELLLVARRPAERAELYRASLDYRAEPGARVSTLHTVAELERGSLGEPDRAIETYRAVLEIDPHDVRAEDALTELYRERRRFDDLAELYERRAEQASPAPAVAAFRLSLARLYLEELDNGTAAIDQYQHIVDALPDHAPAIADLERLTQDASYKARVVDMLRPLYERADDWRKLISLNEQRLELAPSSGQRIAILRENAEFWEKRGHDDAAALRSLRLAFELDPDDGETRTELDRIAEKTGSWDALAAAYEHGIGTADPLVKRQLLTALAALHDKRRDDPRHALDALGRLFALDENDPEPLEQMDQLATLLSDWESVVKILTRKVDLVTDDQERASLLRRVGETKRDMLDDSRGATSAYERALDLDPESTFTIDSLIELYQNGNEHRKLVELYKRRVELTQDGDGLKYTLLLAAAERLESELGDSREAIDCLRQAAALRPADQRVLHGLDRLYRAEQMWLELLDNLRAQVSAAATRDERVRLRKEIGALFASKLEDAHAAIEAYRQVLDEVPEDAEAIAAVSHIGETREDLSLLAADVLEPVLRSAGQHEKLVEVLEMKVSAEIEPVHRAATLKSMAHVLDAFLKRPAQAQGVLMRALGDVPDDRALHVAIDRLAANSDGYGRYADILEERASATFDAAISHDLWHRLGKIAEDELKDDARAIRAYAKASEQGGDDADILAALDRLYVRTGNARALGEILERRVAIESLAEHQAELYFRLAEVQIHAFQERSLGLGTLKQALERSPAHAPSREALESLTSDATLFEEAADALETVYRGQGDDARLIALQEKRITFADSARERTRIRLELARLLEVRSKDTTRAQAVLEEALDDDPTDLDVLAEIERLAAVNQGWVSAAARLSAAIHRAGDLTSDEARDAYVRLSNWYEEKLKDSAAGEAALESALERDPENVEILRAIERIRRTPGRERDLVKSLRRLAELELDPASKRQLFREAKVLAEEKVGDPALTEAVLRQLLEDDEANSWALEELTRLRESAGDYREVLKLLIRRGELSTDGLELLRLQHQAAQIARTKLGDAALAIELYETICENSPADGQAAEALRQLYAEHGRDRDLARLLDRLIDVAPSAEERTRLRLELSRLQASSSTADAIETLRSVLLENPTETDAVVLLSQLYEKEGRDEELAELLTSQIELAKERGDSAAELALTVRLGEIYEARLGNVTKAIEAYEMVLEREPNNRGALESLARLHEGKGDLVAASSALERLLATTEAGHVLAIALRLADVLARMNDDAGRERALERGLEAAPSDAEVRRRLGKSYEKSAQWGKLADLTAGDAQTTSDAAEKVRLYRAAAELYQVKQNQPARAAELFERASALAPLDRELLLALCDAYTAAGRTGEAASTLEKVVASFGGKRSKELAAIHQRLARARLAEGDSGRALAELDQAFKIDPGSVSVLRDLGALAIDTGDLERAQKTYRALLLQKLDATSPISKAEVFLRLGEIAGRLGDKPKAVQMLERALENDPGLSTAKAMLAELRA